MEKCLTAIMRFQPAKANLHVKELLHCRNFYAYSALRINTGIGPAKTTVKGISNSSLGYGRTFESTVESIFITYYPEVLAPLLLMVP